MTLLQENPPVQAFGQAGQWMIGREPSIVERLAVDGETLRGSGRLDGQVRPLLSAVKRRDPRVQAAGGNHPGARRQHDCRRMRCDAMQCQQAAARYTTQERGSADLFGLKGNQESVLARAIVRFPQACFL